MLCWYDIVCISFSFSHRVCCIVDGRMNGLSVDALNKYPVGSYHECKIAVGGGGTTRVVFKKNQSGVLTLHNAATSITKANLNQGVAPSIFSNTYALKLNSVKDIDVPFTPGMMLGSILGGIGTEPANIFPQSPVLKDGLYADYEQHIHDCLESATGVASVVLRWEFIYRTDFSARPSIVKYKATFEGDGKACPSTYLSFDN